MTDVIPVVELFGPTIQGEGPYAGRNADFVRLGGCNLSCSWCDTAYAWDASRYNLRDEITPLTDESVLAALSGRRGIVVLTGGEPLLHQRNAALLRVLRRLREVGRPVHVETNGTILPTEELLELVEVFVLSPKLSNAQLPPHQRATPHAGWANVSVTAEVHAKLVLNNRGELQEALNIARSIGLPDDHIWLMPQAADPNTLAALWPDIADAAAEAGVNACTRLHVLAWGLERGR